MSAAEQFLERARAHKVGYAPWLDRRRSLEILADVVLPEPRCEAWKYSNPNRWYEANDPLIRSDFEISASAGVTVVDFEQAGRNERDVIAANLNATIDAVRFPLAPINDVLLHTGLLVHVPADAVAVEIDIGRLAGGYEHVLVVVEHGASATLIELPGKPTHRIVESVVGDGASLVHARLQAPADSIEYHLVSTRLSANATYKLTQYAQGAALRRNDVYVEAAGDGASIEIFGAWRLSDRQHLDTQISVHHTAAGATSRQTIRGVIDDHGKAVFSGRIYIAPGAQRTDAALTTKNLLLAPTAEVNAKPELEIYANDVKCAHGATVGELDRDALFYLRSRGVTEPLARQLLIASFLAEAVSGPTHRDARALLEIGP